MGSTIRGNHGSESKKIKKYSERVIFFWEDPRKFEKKDRKNASKIGLFKFPNYLVESRFSWGSIIVIFRISFIKVKIKTEKN